MRHFIFIAIGFGVILVLHSLGMAGWYQSVKFYDKFLHFLGGTVWSAAIIFLLPRLMTREPSKLPRLFYLTFAFTAVITIGVIWEFFEFFFLPYLQMGIGDTLRDIFWAGIGAIFVIIIILYENFRHRHLVR